MQTRTARTPAQLFALAIGVVYLAVGIVGFFFADEFTNGAADDRFIIFRLNHVHNIVHLALGVGWLGASGRHNIAKIVNLLFGAVLILVAILGFTAIDLMHTLLNITESSEPDNFLHLITGALGVYFGTAGAGGAVRPGMAR